MGVLRRWQTYRKKRYSGFHITEIKAVSSRISHQKLRLIVMRPHSVTVHTEYTNLQGLRLLNTVIQMLIGVGKAQKDHWSSWEVIALRDIGPNCNFRYAMIAVAYSVTTSVETLVH